MDPKIIVVLGMGGLMFLLLVIVGIIAWVNSEEEDDDTSTNGSSSGDSTGSGGATAASGASGATAASGGATAASGGGAAASGGGAAASGGAGGNSEQGPNNGTCRGGLAQGGYSSSESGYSHGGLMEDQYWNLRAEGWACAEDPWASLAKSKEDCPMKYATTTDEDGNPSYSQCKWHEERQTENGHNVRCVPDGGFCNPQLSCLSQKCCDTTGKWNGLPNHPVGESLQDNCRCPTGTELKWADPASDSGTKPTSSDERAGTYMWKCD